MNDLIREIGSLLVSNGIAAGINNDVFLDYRPDTPDNIICIKEYEGFSVSHGVDIHGRKIQILVRNTNSLQAKSKSKEIFDFLCPDDPECTIDLNDDRCALIEAMQTPFKLEVDNKNRTVYVCNYSILTTSD